MVYKDIYHRIKMITKIYENYVIVIGKNKNENDTLVRTSDANDIWFHLQDYSSCHVVVKLINIKLTRQIIKQAALFVKQNSSHKNEKVSVMWCKIKNLTFTSVPGCVIANECNTLVL